jgi:hypothetical protein
LAAVPNDATLLELFADELLVGIVRGKGIRNGLEEIPPTAVPAATLLAIYGHSES